MDKKKLITFCACVLTVLFSLNVSYGLSLLKKERVVRDEYLEKLFAPDVPHESMQIVEDVINDTKGWKEIRVKMKEKIKEDIFNKYTELLLSRGVNVYGQFHYGAFSWQTTVTEYAITITRKVEGEPDTVEISESEVKDPHKKKPIVAASAKGKEFKLIVEKDFGKKWKKIKIIPDKEPDVKDLDIGRYPGSKLRYAYEWPAKQGGGKMLFYVSKDSLSDVALYYEKKLKGMYKKIYFLYRDELENPKFGVIPLEIFNIKTIGQSFIVSGHEPFKGKRSIKIRMVRSFDPNLKNYVQIDIGDY